MFQPRAIKKTFYWLVYFFLTYIKPGGAQYINASTWTLPGTTLYFKTLEDVNKTKDFMRYCDTTFPIYDKDEFMNRVVSIHKLDGLYHKTPNQIITTGVFINSNHILTSYGPFKTIISNNQYARVIENFFVLFYRAKWLDDQDNTKGYLLERVELTCGVEVMPEAMSYRYAPKEKSFWMLNKDLMIFKTEKDYEFVDKPFFYNDTARQLKLKVIGPQKTVLANVSTLLKKTELKYVSLGMIDNDHIYNRNHLHTVTLDAVRERAVIDCSYYLYHSPNARICIENLENYEAISSGALLFSDDMLFGVGSFTLIKADINIFVFSDVRMYYEMIYVMCTAWDYHGP